jgi:hypothetical protein
MNEIDNWRKIQSVMNAPWDVRAEMAPWCNRRERRPIYNYRESEDELDKLTDQIFQGINWRGSLKLDVLGINNAMLQGYLLILA